MKEFDLRNRIIKTRINNTDKSGNIGNEEFDTEDFIYLETYDEWYEKLPPIRNREKNKPRITSANGKYCKLPIASRSNPGRVKEDELCIEAIGAYRNRNRKVSDFFGICPSLRFKIKDTDKIDEFKISRVKDDINNFTYHRLQIGEYPKYEADDRLSRILEETYNNRKFKDDIDSTGRYYTKVHKGNIKLLPEFKYKGKKYVREVEDGPYYKSIRWTIVKPIDFIIKNWEDLPTNINPKGNGKDKYFELRAEDAIFTMQFYPKVYHENGNMWQNSIIRGYLNGIDVEKIQENGNPKFGAKEGGNFTGKQNFLNEAFNLEREPIIEYEIPQNETEISSYAFDGCISLTKIVIHDKVNKIGKECFKGLNFKYIYKLKTGEIVLSRELPKREAYEIIEIENILSNLDGITIEDIFEEGNLNYKIIEFSNNLDKYKFYIPYVYAKYIIDNNMEEEFFENSDFRIFKKEFSNLKGILNNYKIEEKIDFFKFAKTLGCFSTEKIKNKEGMETETTLAQKATSLLVRLLKTKEMQLGQYHQLFDSLPFDIKPNQEFLQFVSKIKNKKFENLELILQLEEEYPGMFVKSMSNFSELKKYRIGLDEKGMPKKVSWKEALKNFYLENKYVGVTDDNRDIAKIIGSRGLSQNVFDTACSLRREALQNQIPENILNTTIIEETMQDSIERIKEKTIEELEDAQKSLNEIYEKQFTYEWLSKNDPHNSIMGLFCSCCGTITSSAYGGDIARASILAPDVQNIVIRNINEEIIAKGTMYINRKDRYGVINDFEINYKYRKHEKEAGRYSVKKGSKEERDRELIYEAFIRGIKAFVQEYDKENPQNTIKQINIGMGYNRLKQQVERLEKSINKLKVPSKYSFNDAMNNKQYIIYSRDKERDGEEK